MDAEVRAKAREQIKQARDIILASSRFLPHNGMSVPVGDPYVLLMQGFTAGEQAIDALDEAATHRDPCEFGNLKRRVEDLERDLAEARGRVEELDEENEELAEECTDHRAKVEHFRGEAERLTARIEQLEVLANRNSDLVRQHNLDHERIEGLVAELDIARKNLGSSDSRCDDLDKRCKQAERRANQNFVEWNGEKNRRRELREAVEEILVGRWTDRLDELLWASTPVLAPVVADMLGVTVQELTRRFDAGELPFDRLRGSGLMSAYALGGVMRYLRERGERRRKVLAAMTQAAEGMGEAG